MTTKWQFREVNYFDRVEQARRLDLQPAENVGLLIAQLLRRLLLLLRGSAFRLAAWLRLLLVSCWLGLFAADLIVAALEPLPLELFVKDALVQIDVDPLFQLFDGLELGYLIGDALHARRLVLLQRVFDENLDLVLEIAEKEPIARENEKKNSQKSAGDSRLGLFAAHSRTRL